jgi:hypothetical protein
MPSDPEDVKLADLETADRIVRWLRVRFNNIGTGLTRGRIYTQEEERLKQETAARVLAEADLAEAKRKRAQLLDWRATVTASLQREGGAFYDDVPKHIRALVEGLADARRQLEEVERAHANLSNRSQLEAAELADRTRQVEALSKRISFQSDLIGKIRNLANAPGTHRHIEISGGLLTTEQKGRLIRESCPACMAQDLLVAYDLALAASATTPEPKDGGNDGC